MSLFVPIAITVLQMRGCSSPFFIQSFFLFSGRLIIKKWPESLQAKFRKSKVKFEFQKTSNQLKETLIFGRIL
jgi:hypothetical protein